MKTFWDFYISCFSFFLLHCPFLFHPSIILLKINNKWSFWMFLQLAKLQKKNYLGPILSVARSLPSPLVLFVNFDWVMLLALAAAFLHTFNDILLVVGRGAFYTLSSLLFWVGHRGGGTSAILSSCAIGEKNR